MELLGAIHVAAMQGHLMQRPSQAPTGFENDTHSKSIALDDIEWYHRLAKLAELRDGGRCLLVPAADLKVKSLCHQLGMVAVILIFDTI